MKAKAKDLRVDELEDTQAVEVITKLAKQNQESIDTCPKDRVETIEKLTFERTIIIQYMPKQMDESEIKAVITEVLAELGLTEPTMKDKGAIMKVLMPRIKGKTDGKMVNTVLSGMMQ